MPITQRQAMKKIKAGQQLVVRAKNGTCWPTFRMKPSAYKCTIGTTMVNATFARKMMSAGRIVCVNRGWYSEGRFKFNDALRDAQGRFRKRK